MKIHKLTNSGLAVVLEVGDDFKALFSYGEPVAFLELNGRPPIPELEVVYYPNEPMSETTKRHLKTFAGKITTEPFAGEIPTEPMEPAVFRLMFGLAVTAASEEELFRCMNPTRTEEKEPCDDS